MLKDKTVTYSYRDGDGMLFTIPFMDICIIIASDVIRDKIVCLRGRILTKKTNSFRMKYNNKIYHILKRNNGRCC